MLVFNGHRSLIGAKPGNFNQDLKIQQHCCMLTVTYFLLAVNWCLLLNVSGNSFVL